MSESEDVRVIGWTIGLGLFFGFGVFSAIAELGREPEIVAAFFSGFCLAMVARALED